MPVSGHFIKIGIILFTTLLLLPVIKDSRALDREALTLEEIVTRLQEKYDNLSGFTCDFSQIQWNRMLNRKERESGLAFMKKPGMMRWEYLDPEFKLFIINEKVIFFYLQEENQVQTFRDKDSALLSTPTLFLAGRGNLQRDFAITFTDQESSIDLNLYYCLKLEPKALQENFENLILAVDKKTFLVTRLIMVDFLKNRSEFLFTNINENVDVPDDKFFFEMPPDVDVLVVQ